MTLTSSSGKSKKMTIKKDLQMCDFPYHEFGSNFVGEMRLGGSKMSKRNASVNFICTATDVTVKKDNTIEC